MKFPDHYSLSDSFRLTLDLWTKAASRVAKAPTTPKVHDLRRITRRLRTYLWVVPRSQRTKPILKCISALRELSQDLGDCRVLQVALRDAKRFNFPPQVLKRIVRSLDQELATTRLTLTESLKEDRRAVLVDLLGQACRDLEQISQEAVFPKLQKALDKVAAFAGDLPKKTAKRHEVRLLIKKINIFLKDFETPDQNLVELQKTLGRWHDLVSLESLVPHRETQGLLKGTEGLKAQRKALWKKVSTDFQKLTKSPSGHP